MINYGHFCLDNRQNILETHKVIVFSYVAASTANRMGSQRCEKTRKCRRPHVPHGNDGDVGASWVGHK